MEELTQESQTPRTQTLPEKPRSIKILQWIYLILFILAFPFLRLATLGSEGRCTYVCTLSIIFFSIPLLYFLINSFALFFYKTLFLKLVIILNFLNLILATVLMGKFLLILQENGKLQRFTTQYFLIGGLIFLFFLFMTTIFSYVNYKQIKNLTH